jgi:hypothetical protein
MAHFLSTLRFDSVAVLDELRTRARVLAFGQTTELKLTDISGQPHFAGKLTVPLPDPLSLLRVIRLTRGRVLFFEIGGDFAR